ncbi:MAG: hypothetical protein J5892_01045 [Bacilli bacterium]|nr:hypothetical protein [Bacilli bacterium]
MLQGIKDSLKDLDAIINVYQNEINVNNKANLITISDELISLFYQNKFITIKGSKLKITELSNITKIIGNIKELTYEVK